MAFVRRSTFALSAALACVAVAQPPGGSPPPQFQSPEVAADKKIAFRIHAPNAKAVRLGSSDLPNVGRGVEMKKGDNGVWEATVGPVVSGAYRYQFNVDGLNVVDPRNTMTSEANATVHSLAYVPGSDLWDTKDVPHGAVAKVVYQSSTLKRPRRMHVYTPPGYEKGEGKYPVFYLLHGASDCDNSWSTVGRAGFILDNLIASGKAKPMIVVMPNGHTGTFGFGGRGGSSFEKQMDEFSEDFMKDVRPYVEKNYRVMEGRENRAIAGLSMGGAQTLNINFSQPKDYGYFGVYSSGVFGIAGGFGGAPPNTAWVDKFKPALDDADARGGCKLCWFGCGKDDFLVKTSDATVEMLRKHKYDVVYHETEGGHTWLCWRDYLAEFAPKLFK
jgi:enterochelin esterase-like enzyme